MSSGFDAVSSGWGIAIFSKGLKTRALFEQGAGWLIGLERAAKIEGKKPLRLYS